MIINECVLDIASQLGGAEPGLVTTYDKSRFHNDGTLTNITWTQLGDGLWYPVYNGATSLVAVATAPSLNVLELESLTIMAWVYLNNTTARHGIVSKIGGGTPANPGYHFTIAPASGFPYLEIADGAQSRYSVFDVAVAVSTWTYLVVVLDARTAIQGYMNGDAVAMTPGGDALNTVDSLENAVQMQIGREQAGGNRFAGGMPKLRMFNYTFSPAQIRARYHAEKWLFGVPV